MTPRQTANKVAKRQLLRATNKIYSKSGKRKGGFGSAAFHWPFKSSSRRDRIKGRSGPLWWPKIKRQWRFPRLHETTYKVRHWDGPYRKSKVTDAEKDEVQKLRRISTGEAINCGKLLTVGTQSFWLANSADKIGGENWDKVETLLVQLTNNMASRMHHQCLGERK